MAQTQNRRTWAGLHPATPVILGSHPVREFGGVREVIMYAWRVLTVH